MIIPPDPEKDPRLFSPNSSTPSLLPPPESDITGPDARNPAVGYPFHDDLGVGYTGDFLPPYERRGDVGRQSREMRQVDRSRSATPRPLAIDTGHSTLDIGHSPITDGTITPTTFASTSRLPLPLFNGESSTNVGSASSTAKLWESSASPPPKIDRKGKGKERFIPFSPSNTAVGRRIKEWWIKYKRWIVGAIILFLIGLGIMIGILVWTGQNPVKEDRPTQSGPAWHEAEPGDGRKNAVWADGSMNLTWVPSRDTPPSSDGNLTLCNTFTPMNASNFSELTYPYPSNRFWSTTFLVPLSRLNTSTTPWTIVPTVPNLSNAGNRTNSTTPSSTSSARPVPSPTYATDVSKFPLGLLADLPIYARGIASSGTIEIIGADSPPEIISQGVEGAIRIDVVVQYGGMQDIMGIMQVCQVGKPDGSLGVGIYTDGKITNLYALDPTTLPFFHVIIRLPPSTVWNAAPGRNPQIHLESASFKMDHMGVRVGDLEGVAQFGRFNITSGRGGAVAEYLAARNVWIASAENTIKGVFNVSESLYINSTDSAIIADVILHDPNSTTNTTLPFSPLAARGAPDAPGAPDATYSSPKSSPTIKGYGDVTLDTTTGHNSTSPSNVNTTFYTTDGYIRVRYVAHPPRTSLTSWIAVSSGEMDISLHPNYVGPFAVRNAWGSVRLPLPRENVYNDPMGARRKRAVVEGIISIPSGSVYARAGLNETFLPRSGTTVTGSAYWQDGPNGTMSPQAVQGSDEGKGNQIYALGGWGDVTLRFDGT